MTRLTRWVFSAVALSAVCSFVCPELAHAQQYTIKVVASGLVQPTGIALDADDDALYFTEVPMPGVAGGKNAVKKLDLNDGDITTLHSGDPQPLYMAIGRDGSIYWTCLSAGVILKRGEDGETTKFLTGLPKPSGIAIDRKGTVYFTEDPTPGVAGGENGVFSASDGGIQTLHMGEPDPVEITVARNGDLYWTCRSAGVILTRNAQDGTVSTLLSGLSKPTGITLDHKGRYLYFTEVPTPGVSGANGGKNKVSKYDLRTGQVSVIHEGDPQPNAIAVSRGGILYWTCTSAGVILEARPVECEEREHEEHHD